MRIVPSDKLTCNLKQRFNEEQGGKTQSHQLMMVLKAWFAHEWNGKCCHQLMMILKASFVQSMPDPVPQQEIAIVVVKAMARRKRRTASNALPRASSSLNSFESSTAVASR